MTQEDKELLLKDLTCRVPYGVICTGKYIDYDDNDNNILKDTTGELTQVHFTKNCCYLNIGLMNECEIETVKPYLRPISSMTEEEKKEYYKAIVKSQDCSFENNESAAMMVSDWLLSKGFDVHGLISKGLALEASEDMYKL